MYQKRIIVMRLMRGCSYVNRMLVQLKCFWKRGMTGCEKGWVIIKLKMRWKIGGGLTRGWKVERMFSRVWRRGEIA